MVQFRPRRKPNAEVRAREYLTEQEIERLVRTAKANLHGQRDALMITLAFRHGLGAAELVDLKAPIMTIIGALKVESDFRVGFAVILALGLLPHVVARCQ
jgi:site-specific recombinase XerD